MTRSYEGMNFYLSKVASPHFTSSRAAPCAQLSQPATGAWQELCGAAVQVGQQSCEPVALHSRRDGVEDTGDKSMMTEPDSGQ